MNETKSHSSRAHGGVDVVPLADVFVSLDLGRDVAYVAYEGATGIQWDELSRATGELLAGLGARTHVNRLRRAFR